MDSEKIFQEELELHNSRISTANIIASDISNIISLIDSVKSKIEMLKNIDKSNLSIDNYRKILVSLNELIETNILLLNKLQSYSKVSNV